MAAAGIVVGAIGAVINFTVADLNVSSQNGELELWMIPPSRNEAARKLTTVIDNGAQGKFHHTSDATDFTVAGTYKFYIVWKPVLGGSFPSKSSQLVISAI
jgi:hypothetical protein